MYICPPAFKKIAGKSKLILILFMKKLVFSTLFVLQAFFVFAQQSTGISGKVIDSKTNKPLQNVIASFQNTNFTQLTNENGEFVFRGVGTGSQLLRIKSDGYKEQLLPIEILANQMLDLGVVVLEEDNQTTEQQVSLITITENDLGDDNSGSESTSGLLQASRDAYQQAAAFNWGQARFRMRGLDNEYGVTLINGTPMNKIYDNRPQWSNWGGLNDATRNQEFTIGSGPSDYTFGNILGTQEINTRASIYRPGNRISFAGTNTNYNWRLMGTTASGLMKDGWAYVISAGRRWAEEAYFEGTTYSANSFFASVEKRIGSKHALNLTTIFAQNRRGKNSPNTAEVTNLTSELYNSYWGWQNGEKRNSRVKDLEEPIFMLNHYWKITDKTKLNSAVTYQFGHVGNSRIGNRNTASSQGQPYGTLVMHDPTYYKNLPSYYQNQYDNDPLVVSPDAYAPGGLGGNFIGNSPANIALADYYKKTFTANPQLNWDALYAANAASGDSFYILYEDRTDDKQLTANTVLSSQLSDNIMLNAGGTFRKLKSHNFKNLLDLLGGTSYGDYDGFYTGDRAQTDLNNPGRNVGVGDTFGYNYNLLANTYDAFTQFKFNYNVADFYLAQTFSRSEYQREGLYKNGLYASNSFGKSDKQIYDNFGFKGGLTIKVTSQHLFDFNGAYISKAPSLRNAFNNARLNNNATIGLTSENISSADASYIIRTPKFKSRVTGFYNYVRNATETSFFFAEGVLADESSFDSTSNFSGDTFVAETLTGLNKKAFGVELGVEYQLTSTIKLTAAGTWGQYTYDNNPNVRVNADFFASETNTNPSFDFGKAYLKDYRISGTPQKAASFGVEYRDPHFWWIGANANYLADNYLDIAPLLRTDNFYKDPTATGGLPFAEATQERGDELLKQEKFDEIKLVNFTGGKSWRVKDVTIGLFASLNNAFNFKYKTGGFEQARNANYRELNQDVSLHPDANGNQVSTRVFGPKYFYGNGRTYFVNFYINF